MRVWNRPTTSVGRRVSDSFVDGVPFLLRCAALNAVMRQMERRTEVAESIRSHACGAKRMGFQRLVKYASDARSRKMLAGGAVWKRGDAMSWSESRKAEGRLGGSKALRRPVRLIQPLIDGLRQLGALDQFEHRGVEGVERGIMVMQPLRQCHGASRRKREMDAWLGLVEMAWSRTGRRVGIG